MSGPFTIVDVEKILRGSIFCSPLLVSVQTQQPGMPDKLRVCRHLSKGDKTTPSTNLHIHKEDFPTRFDTASRIADIVGSFRFVGGISSFMVSFFFFVAHIWWLFHHGLTSHVPLLMGSHLVSLLLMGFTSRGPFFHGFTSG